MGGSWDATNVADAQVAVVLPIAVDHAKYLGETPADIALEKAGIIKPGSIAVLAEQRPEVAEVLLRRAAEVGATVVREGMEFGVVSRVPAVGGQVISLQGLRGAVRRGLPAAVRRPPGAERRRRAGRGRGVRRRPAARRGAGPRRVRGGHLARPARDRAAQPDDRARRRPQPARRRGARRGARGLLRVLPADRRHRRDGRQGPRGAARGVGAAPGPRRGHPELHARAPCRPRELAEAARAIFGEDRVTVAPRLADALDQAAALAEAGEAFGDPLGAGAVLVTGSVVTVGEARTMLTRPEAGRADERARSPPPRAAPGGGRSPRRGMCAAVLCLEAITLGLSTPVMISVGDVDTGHRARDRARAGRGLPAAGRHAPRASGPTRWAGWSRSPRSPSACSCR